MPNQIGRPGGGSKAVGEGQLGLLFDERARLRQAHPTWGGTRKGAGRKPRVAQRPSARHVARPRHAKGDPVHVTMRARRDVPFLRSQLVFAQVRACIRAAQRADFRIVQFSAQRDHLHLVVEASDKASLSRGMQGLAVRIARGVNRATRLATARKGTRTVERRGAVWAERYHRRDLRSPREVRNALVYVLQNHMKHAAIGSRGGEKTELGGLDPCSSSAWFEGWTARAGPLVAALAADDVARPVARPRTWLARVGWRRHRLIDPSERPSSG